MKRILAIFLTVVVLSVNCIVCAVSASAASSADDFFVYEGVLVEYVGNGGDVIIPDNLGIKEIGAKAFYDNTSIKSVVIPEGITKIGDKAFEGCTFLKTVDLPYSLTDLGTGVFRLCEMIESIVIPGKVKSINSDCFAGCLALSNVVISYGVQEIGVYAFSQTALTNVIIPETVKYISGRAFVNLTASRFTVTICNPTCDMGYYEINSGEREKGYDTVFEGQSHIKTAITIRSTEGSFVNQYAKDAAYQPAYGKYNYQSLTLDDIKAIPENQKDYGKQSPTTSNTDAQTNTNNDASSQNNATDAKDADSDITMVIIIAAAVILLVIIIAVIVLVVMNNNKKQNMQMQLLMEQLKQKSQDENK